ncbi:MAG: endonuclease/exonuclease/phosphatase family protein [Alphaproteobacteria bacterium]|nr:endonuclease/exonuclease/phosphatase family protein [Alphaproteobacteria bacterium]
MKLWRKTWTVCVLLAALGLATLSATAIFRSDAWIADLIESFRPHLLVAAAMCLPLGLTVRGSWRTALVAIFVACVVANSATIIRTVRAATPPPQEARGGIRLTVVTTNLLWSNTQHQRFRDWLHAEAPDIVVTQETTRRWAAELDKLDPLLPYRRLPGHGDDLAILSRYPFEMAELAGIRQHGTLAMARLSVGHRRIDLMALHASVPIHPAWQKARDTMFDDIARFAWRTRHPLIVAGDFNATPWNRSMRRLVRESPLRHAPGFWRPTWTAYAPNWMGIPIDHVLAATDCRVIDRRVGPDIGSDHRPVIATVDCL